MNSGTIHRHQLLLPYQAFDFPLLLSLMYILSYYCNEELLLKALFKSLRLPK